MCRPMSELEPGRLVRIALDVRRLVAPNPSLLTGPGTNTYLLGEPVTAVIDPGPPEASHIETIARAAPQLALIFVTHTHADHSSGARALAARTGARLIGRAPPVHGPQDRSFVPDLSPRHGQCFALGCGVLRALHTPGHASNHVCYLLEAAGLLFSGDHILDGVTPVIAPPDGSMSDYLESLRNLLGHEASAIAPGHGRLLGEPRRVIEGVLQHRARRESKVVSALAALGAADLEELLAPVYADVPEALHALARQSLEAHLIKLADEGRCERRGTRWHARA